jgi:hypothetical protein
MQTEFRRVRRAIPPNRAIDGEIRQAQRGMGSCTVELELVRRRPGLRLAVAAVLVAVVVGFGVAGRFLSAAESGPAVDRPHSGPITVTQTAVAVLQAGEVSGSSAANVAVRLSASRPIGLIRVSVELGGLVLGSTAANITVPGEITVGFQILRPEVAVEAEVQVATDPVGAIVARAPLPLRAAGPVQVWRLVASRLPAGRARIEIEALAPAQVTELQVSLRSETGILFGEAVAIPGAGAGDWTPAAATFDLAAFRGSTAVSGWTGAPMMLEISWTNPRNGSRNELRCMQEVVQNWRWTLPARS